MRRRLPRSRDRHQLHVGATRILEFRTRLTRRSARRSAARQTAGRRSRDFSGWRIMIHTTATTSATTSAIAPAAMSASIRWRFRRLLVANIFLLSLAETFGSDPNVVGGQRVHLGRRRRHGVHLMLRTSPRTNGRHVVAHGLLGLLGRARLADIRPDAQRQQIRRRLDARGLAARPDTPAAGRSPSARLDPRPRRAVCGPLPCACGAGLHRRRRLHRHGRQHAVTGGATRDGGDQGRR